MECSLCQCCMLERWIERLHSEPGSGYSQIEPLAQGSEMLPCPLMLEKELCPLDLRQLREHDGHRVL